MTAAVDRLDAARELLEVLLLRATHRMPPEERNDRLQQIRAASHDIPVQVLVMVVVPPIHDHLPDSEELTEIVETREALLPLGHRELVSNLETGLVADSALPAWLPDETDREASFSVYETDHPATELDQPFLLVFRTRHVVTMVNVLSDVTR